jgi:hypothetical protein
MMQSICQFGGEDSGVMKLNVIDQEGAVFFLSDLCGWCCDITWYNTGILLTK